MSVSARGGISPRFRYAIGAALCILNILGMFLVAFGAAAGGRWAVLLWPAVGLMAGGILVLAALSAYRASQVGLSPWATAVAAILLCFAGPAVPVLIVYLVIRNEKEGGPPVRPGSPWLFWLFLLFFPWAVVWAVRYAAGI